MTPDTLTTYFASAQLPETFTFVPAGISTNPEKTVQAHLAFVRNYWGRPIARPYLIRLRQLVEATGGDWQQLLLGL